VTEALYSARDVARIFALKESRVLYWARTGFVGPSVKRGGRLLFNFQDLISVKAAKELLDRGLSVQSVRKNLAALRGALPTIERPLSRLRVLSDGERLVVSPDGDGAPFEALSGQLVMDFAVGALSTHVAEMMRLGPTAPPAEDTADRGAYEWFLEGCAAFDAEEDAASAERAADAFRRALDLDPAIAAAHTNLGSLAHRLGRLDEARDRFEQALTLDPEQPEARYNLANLLAEIGETELAIAEWTRVASTSPDFADAHFNLGAALLREGAADAARAHLERYLALDAAGSWADEARALLGAP
jgi:tetratricopeptide (TPR) repeat protein